MAKYPKDEPTAETPVEPAEPPKRVMTLQEARGAFMPMLQGWRGMVKMGEAIEAALTAEAQASAAERRKAEALAEVARLEGVRREVDEGVGLARASLTGVQDAARIAKEDLERTQLQIREAKAQAVKDQDETRKAWDIERRAWDKEAADTKGKLDKVRAEFAAVVKQHAA